MQVSATLLGLRSERSEVKRSRERRRSSELWLRNSRRTITHQQQFLHQFRKHFLPYLECRRTHQITLIHL